MAENEVFEEVSNMVANEEKYVFDMNSFQDLPKLNCNGANHHNQTNNINNSYVVVSGTGGDSKDISNEDLKAGDSVVLSESDTDGVTDQEPELHSQIDAASGKFQPMNEKKGIIIEQSNEDHTLVISENKDIEAESLSVLPESDVVRVKDVATEFDSQIEMNDTTSREFCHPSEVENSLIQLGNGDLANNKDVEADVLIVHHSEGEKITSGEFQPLIEEGISIAEWSNEVAPLVNLDTEDVEADNLSILPDSDASVVKDQVELHSKIGKEDTVSVEFQPFNEAENSMTSSVDPYLEKLDNTVVKVEGLSVFESDAVGVQDLKEELHPQVEKIDAAGVNFNPLNEADISITERSIADPPSENVDVKHVAEAQSLDVLPESDASGLRDPYLEKLDNTNVEVEGLSVLESDAVEVQDLKEELHPQVEKIDAVGGNFNPLNEADISITERSIADPPSENVDVNHVAEAQSLGVLPGSDASGLRDPEAELRSHNEFVDTVGQLLNEVENCITEVGGTEGIRDQLDGTTETGSENSLVQENEDSGSSLVTSVGGSSVNSSDGKEQIVKFKTKPFNFLTRSPRFDDENLREQIRLAKIHVDEKTKLRDAVLIQIQEKRTNSQVHGNDYEYAKSEARSARKLVRSKRMEIDSLQSVINKAKNALSIEDIDSQICNMEHMIQHETLPLKEEKQLIREIKQLKQLREQLSSNMGSPDEIQQAVEQRGEVEERLKILRKELHILKTKVLKAEDTASEAERKYDDEIKKVRELQTHYRAADDVRQAAYAQWQNLRKELSKKSEPFFKYKDDVAVAYNYAYSGDTEELYLLCSNQVHNFMELWNTNQEFRKEYVKFNRSSTVRRFGTLDGRALGPDEVAPHLPNYADERASRKNSASLVKVDGESQVPNQEVKQETTSENMGFVNKMTKKVMESNYQKVTKEPAISVQASGLDTHSVEVYEETIRSKEEIESLRREEEKKREEMEAKLIEQRRVEALAKANEARERKKRQAEKLQMRADLKTQKEAEQREKEREKRLRKKERKKAGVTDGNDTNINCESYQSSESAVESSKDIEVVNEALNKKHPQKSWLSGKQSKAKTIPPPLRNRNKKKLQQWMWVGVSSVMILILFWLGNIGIFSDIVALKRRGAFRY